MTVHGVVNCWVDGRGIDPPTQIHSSPVVGLFAGATIFQLSTTFFVSLYKFLISSQAQSLGIVRRAYNKGTSTSVSLQYSASLGMDYWDERAPIGNHAWAVFEFTQAYPKFWVLLQLGVSTQVAADATGGTAYNDENGFGNTFPGFPGKLLLPWAPGSTNTGAITDSTNHSGVGISIAMERNGNSPWRGTTNDDGADTKGNPVWSDVMVWPRTANSGGVGAVNKHHMFGLYYDLACWKGIGGSSQTRGAPQLSIETFFTHQELKYDSHDSVFHMFVDKDQILVLNDSMNIHNHSIFYFGRYEPFMSSTHAPYVCLYKNLMFNDNSTVLTVNSNQVYGSRDLGWNSTAGEDQALNNSMLHHGGIIDPATGNVIGASLGLHATLSSSNPFFESSMNSVKPKVTNVPKVHNPIVYINEFPGRRSPVGEITFFKMASNVRSNVTFAGRLSASFGTSQFNSPKVIVPWHTGSYPGQFLTRSGTIF